MAISVAENSGLNGESYFKLYAGHTYLARGIISLNAHGLSNSQLLESGGKRDTLAIVRTLCKFGGLKHLVISAAHIHMAVHRTPNT